MAIKKDVDTLINEHLEQVKKLRQKKFEKRFKIIIKDLEKYQDKISDEDIEKLHHTFMNRYGKKSKENQENQA